MHEASYYIKEPGNKVRCMLCPHECSIGPGRKGICRVRLNMEGNLVSSVYGKASAVRFDPIEKKPLYHFHPGSVILSVGTVGCNLHCKFCQNWEISQTCAEDYPYQRRISPVELIAMTADRVDNIGIAYTYNEPTVFFEYMIDSARLARDRGLKNVVITNGYINPDPLGELLDYADAFNVDLKAFDDDFYRRVTGARLEPVKNTIRTVSRENKHLELTNLVITGFNDKEEGFREMLKWIAGELGPDTPLHLSRYFPNYEMEAPSTPEQTLMDFYHIARENLYYVYLGNIYSKDGSRTHCPECGNLVIDRQGYSTYKTGLDPEGHCTRCGHQIIRDY